MRPCRFLDKFVLNQTTPPDAARLVPVLDLQHGQAVHAVRGDRARYQPVRSRLVTGSAPVDVARALLRVADGATQLYVADLDAIIDGQLQVAALSALVSALPGIELWLDGGFRDLDAGLSAVAALGERVVPVYGSESLASLACLRRMRAEAPRALLSLDRRGETLLDPAGCWSHPTLWPQRVVVMTLERVGSGAGPDLARLREVRAQAGDRCLIGAGGVRDRADLIGGAQAGAQAWLVATALHDGRLAGGGPSVA